VDSMNGQKTRLRDIVIAGSKMFWEFLLTDSRSRKAHDSQQIWCTGGTQYSGPHVTSGLPVIRELASCNEKVLAAEPNSPERRKRTIDSI
jgi:hypothetical protein